MNETWLIGEHDQVFRRLICRFLLSEAYRVVQACSPLEPLRIPPRHDREIDLLLTDGVGLIWLGAGETSQARLPQAERLFIPECVDTEAVALAERMSSCWK